MNFVISSCLSPLDFERFLRVFMTYSMLYRFYSYSINSLYLAVEMSIESKVENFFKGLISQTPNKRSKPTVHEAVEVNDVERDENGALRGRGVSTQKAKTRSASKHRQVLPGHLTETTIELESVGDLPVVEINKYMTSQ